MLVLYRLALYLAFPLVVVRLLLCALRDRRYFAKLPQRFGFGFKFGITGSKSAHGGIWIHAVSVGEVNAATPLVEYLLTKSTTGKMRAPIILTTTTPTGADRARATFGKRVQHCHLPYDYPGAARRFLACAQPRVAVVMETEIWPNFIARCHQLGIPTLYVNARLSHRSHQKYRKLHRFIAPTLRKVTRFAAQSENDARRLRDLGARAQSVVVTGNLKFDLADLAKNTATINAGKRLRAQWGKRLVWLVGSTHEGEEEEILAAFARLRKQFTSLLLVLAPRHPQRFAAVHRLCARRYKTVSRTEMQAGSAKKSASATSTSLPTDVAVYLADTMGELPMLIAAADVAFIGGSLRPIGGHNILEAAAVGVPVVFGAHMFNFSEIAELVAHGFGKGGGGVQVADREELVEAVGKLLGDARLRTQMGKRGRELVQKNRGALQKVCKLVDAELQSKPISRNPISRARI